MGLFEKKIAEQKAKREGNDGHSEEADIVKAPVPPQSGKPPKPPFRPPGATAAKKAVEGDMKQKAYYSDDVMLKMTTLLYDPLTIELCKEADVIDVAQLLGLTNIKSSKEAFYWAHRLATEAYANRYRPGGVGGFNDGGGRKWSIAKIEMVAFLIARRSMTLPVGSAFALGVGLAQEQQIEKSEQAGEEESW